MTGLSCVVIVTTRYHNIYIHVLQWFDMATKTVYIVAEYRDYYSNAKQRHVADNIDVAVDIALNCIEEVGDVRKTRDECTTFTEADSRRHVRITEKPIIES